MGSNPTGTILVSLLGPVAQWIARKTSNLKVAGSSPARVAFLLRLASLYGGLAQSVECVVCNDEAPGSKPGFSSYFCSRRHLGRVVKAVDSKSTGLRPRQFESGTYRFTASLFAALA